MLRHTTRSILIGCVSCLGLFANLGVSHAIEPDEGCTFYLNQLLDAVENSHLQNRPTIPEEINKYSSIVLMQTHRTIEMCHESSDNRVVLPILQNLRRQLTDTKPYLKNLLEVEEPSIL